MRPQMLFVPLASLAVACGGGRPAQPFTGTGPPPGVQCGAAPLPFQIGRSLTASIQGGPSLVEGSCLRKNASECVFTIEVRERADLRVALLSANFDGALALLGPRAPGSTRLDAELACVDDAPLGDTHHARLDVSLEPGSYGLVVDGGRDDGGEFELFAELEPLPSLSQVCQRAEPLLEGVFQRGSTRAAVSSFASSCGQRAAGPDHAYAFQLERPARVRVRERSELDMLLSLRSRCAAEESELSCSDGASAEATVNAELGAGVYYLVVDGYTRGEGGDYVLTMERAEPPPVTQHTVACAAAPLLQADGTRYELDTFYASSTTAASCGGEGAPEALFSFVLSQRRLVTLYVSDFEFDAVYSLRRACEYPESEIVCAAPPRAAGPSGEGVETSIFSLELEAGDYMLGVDGQRASAMGAGSVRLTAEPVRPNATSRVP